MEVRISHQQEKVIPADALRYLNMQERIGDFYFKPFLQQLRQLDCTGKILEIGSGPGYMTAKVALENPTAKITAIEPSPTMLETAAAYLQKKIVDHRVRLVEGCVEDSELIQSLGKFDLIYSTFSLHHWQEPPQAIANLMRALKDGGTLFIHDFNRNTFLRHLPFGGGMLESIRAAYTAPELRCMMHKLLIEDFTITTPSIFLSLLVKK